MSLLLMGFWHQDEIPKPGTSPDSTPGRGVCSSGDCYKNTSERRKDRQCSDLGMPVREPGLGCKRSVWPCGYIKGCPCILTRRIHCLLPLLSQRRNGDSERRGTSLRVTKPERDTAQTAALSSKPGRTVAQQLGCQAPELKYCFCCLLPAY